MSSRAGSDRDWYQQTNKQIKEEKKTTTLFKKKNKENPVWTAGKLIVYPSTLALVKCSNMIFHTLFQKSLKEFLLASHCFQLPFCSWIKHSLFPFIFTSQLFPQNMNDCRSRLKLLSPSLITGLSFITYTYCTVTSRICCVCVMLAHLLLSVIKFQWEAQSHANDQRVPAREWSGLSINVLKGTHELLEHFFTAVHLLWNNY